MEKKALNFLNKILLISSLAIIVCLLVFLVVVYLPAKQNQNSFSQNSSDIRNYHVIVTGTYENKDFIEKVFEGAFGLSDNYNALVELYVPQSQAESLSLQQLFDYCTFVNADGVIAFINSTEDSVILNPRTDGTEIPLVTTGQFAAGVHQISYIGNNYWKFGKVIAQEILYYLEEEGFAYIITQGISKNTNHDNLVTSLQNSLYSYDKIKIQSIENIDDSTTFHPEHNIFIAITEEETITAAQILSDFYADKNYILIGFGNNETCRLYLQKGMINELIYLNPKAIGQTAIKELFEYRNKGYANSYIAADVLIEGPENEKKV